MRECIHRWMDESFLLAAPRQSATVIFTLQAQTEDPAGALLAFGTKNAPVWARLPGAHEVIPHFTQLDFGAYSRG